MHRRQAAREGGAKPETITVSIINIILRAIVVLEINFNLIFQLNI